MIFNPAETRRHQKEQKFHRHCYISVGVAAAISAVVAVAGTAATVYSQQKAAAIQQSLIQKRQEQNRLALADREGKRLDSLSRVFSAQRAISAARGISEASPSFNAIKLQSWDAAEKDNKNDSLNTNFQNSSLNIEKEAAQARANAESIGSVASLGGKMFNQINFGSGSGGAVNNELGAPGGAGGTLELPNPTF